MTNALWIALGNMKGIGVKTIKKLYTAFPYLTEDTIYTHFDAISEAFKHSKTIQKMLDKAQLAIQIDQAKAHIKFHEDKGIQIIDLSSEYYPALLQLIDDPPVVLYGKGNLALLKEDRKIAIIGTRKPTALGEMMAKKVAAAFCKRDFIIVSGLAVGIDAAAHQAAVDTNGKTIAVLAGSLNNIYPKNNIGLANDILHHGGLLISETPLGGATHRSAFVLRDRIQSGLSLGVCPIQTALKSGTQHTISYAQKQHRLLFCPIPSESRDIEVTQGIYHLLESELAEVIRDETDYERVEQRLIDNLENLKQNTKRNDKDNPQNKPLVQLSLFGNKQEDANT